MKEFFEALHTRLKSPVFGYFLLAWFIVNWKPLLLLVFGSPAIEDRIEAFQGSTSLMTLAGYPLLLGAVAAIGYPFLHLIFLRLVQWPTDRKNALEAESEGALLQKKAELEAKRATVSAAEQQHKEVLLKASRARERDLIEQAKRDLEISQIENQELREKLQMDVEMLREREVTPELIEKMKKDVGKLSPLLGVTQESIEEAASRTSVTPKKVTPRKITPRKVTPKRVVPRREE